MNIRKLNEIREVRNLSCVSIAEQSGVPYRTVSKLFSGENQNPTWETITAITRVLNCSLDELLNTHPREIFSSEEIKRILLTQPQKLSLNEFYLAAQTCEPGTDPFNEIFETAVRMYPDDEVANLNAANSAMQKGDLKSAGRYLQKAGESPEALYARGEYAMLTEEYETAAVYWGLNSKLRIAPYLSF